MKKYYIVWMLCCVFLTACKEKEITTDMGDPLYTRSFVLQYKDAPAFGFW